MNFLPKRFRPNRSYSSRSNAIAPQENARAGEILRQMVVLRFEALLAGAPPPLLDSRALMRAIRMPNVKPATIALTPERITERRPLSAKTLFALSKRRKEFLRLFAEDQPLAQYVFTRRQITQALRAAPLQFALGKSLVAFLCERVVFHPGAPPNPSFSPEGLRALLHSPDPRLNLLLLPRAEDLAQLGFWDQFLLRRMKETALWALPEGAANLPFVAWTNGNPPPKAAQDQLPDYWPSLLDLTF